MHLMTISTPPSLFPTRLALKPFRLRKSTALFLKSVPFNPQIRYPLAWCMPPYIKYWLHFWSTLLTSSSLVVHIAGLKVAWCPRLFQRVYTETNEYAQENGRSNVFPHLFKLNIWISSLCTKSGASTCLLYPYKWKAPRRVLFVEIFKYSKKYC